MKHLTYISLLLAQPLIAQEKPNIIIFLVDDMGIMDTSLPFLIDDEGIPTRTHLNDFYHTPNMERMAKQGIRFSTFYAQSVSSPSRTSIMTGQNATRHHTTNWINSESNNKTPFGPQKWNWDGLTSKDATIPSVLKIVGYKTIHIGKAHFGRIGSEGENPSNIGFDINIAGSSIGQPGSYYGEHGYGHIKGNKTRAVPDLAKYHETETFLSEALTLEASAQITQATQENKPFFLYMAHYAVHAPFEPDKRFLSHYKYSEKPQAANHFATLIEGMDKSLGDIMDHLEKLGIAENTLIIFLGDNGSDAPLGDEKGYSSSAPLRGKKGTEYEGGTRTPFIVSWGKRDSCNINQQKLSIPANRIQSQLGTVMDIYPTILTLANAQAPSNHIIDGTDLNIQLHGERNKNRPETFLMHFPHEHRGSYFTTFRDGDWKLIYYYNPEKPSAPSVRLYNLKNDPGESHDLSFKNPGQVANMTCKMRAQLEKENALYPEDREGQELKPMIIH